MKILNNSKPLLYLVPTPIGNLDDITLRAIDILKIVDYIFCEDTRRARILLKKFDISKPLKSLHSYNIERKTAEIIDILQSGKKVAYISDSGTPGISDPGASLVRKASEAGFSATVLPGASAVLPAVVMSGLRCDKFIFLGFAPASPTKRRRLLRTLTDFPFTLIFYESPHRLTKFLDDAFAILGDRNCTVIKEISKIHESIYIGNISELIEYFGNGTVRGEFVVVLN